MQIHFLIGVASFVGSQLIDRLIEEWDEMICFENYFSGRTQHPALDSSFPLELIRYEVTEPINLEVGRTSHLACSASPIHYQFKTAKTSFVGAYNLLGFVRWVGARWISSAPVRCTVILRCTSSRRNTGFL